MKNSLLRLERLRKGWSQEHLAGFSGVSVRTVQRAERGEPLRSDNIQLLCVCFGKTPEELGILNLEVEQKQVSSEKPLQHSNSEGIDIVTVTNMSLIDQSMIDKLDAAESIIDLAWEVWFASRPKHAAREISRLLPNLEKMLYHPGLNTLRINELVIRSHGLLGTVNLDALQNDTALFHYMQAHKFAEEISDKDQTATYMSLIGDVLRRQNDKTSAIRYMENARDLTKNANDVTRGHILQLLAYAYGDIGNRIAFERTISEATDLLSFTGEGRDTAKKEFIPFEIYEIRGKVNRDLGRPLDAIPYLELAEKSLNKAESVTPRWYALLEISRGQAFCDAGDITAAIDSISKGLMLAYQCHSPHQMNRVRKLLRKLENGPFRNHARVQDLKNLLYEIYMRMDNGAM